MTLGFRVKFFLNKRISPIAKVKWDLKSIFKGYRKRPNCDNAIDCGGKQHIHIYPTLRCHMDCYFCQNGFYTDKLPEFDETHYSDWAKLLNRFYNYHHLDFNGGEPFLYSELFEILNRLDNHNIVVFTNLPKFALRQIELMEKRNNNIMLCVSYHPLNETREIPEFIDDFKKIPDWLHPSVHVIDIPEISYKNVRTAFARRGVYIQNLDAIVPTDHNRVDDSKFQTRLCNSNMDCLAPDMTVYQCTGLMLRRLNGKRIDDYDFNLKYKRCDYHGLCGPCLTQRDVKRYNEQDHQKENQAEMQKTV